MWQWNTALTGGLLFKHRLVHLLVLDTRGCSFWGPYMLSDMEHCSMSSHGMMVEEDISLSSLSSGKTNSGRERLKAIPHAHIWIPHKPVTTTLLRSLWSTTPSLESKHTLCNLIYSLVAVLNAEDTDLKWSYIQMIQECIHISMNHVSPPDAMFRKEPYKLLNKKDDICTLNTPRFVLDGGLYE